VRVPPLLPFRTALIPIASNSGFVCAGFPFSEWAIGLRAGFSLKGETDGIQTTVLSYPRGGVTFPFASDIPLG